MVQDSDFVVHGLCTCHHGLFLVGRIALSTVRALPIQKLKSQKPTCYLGPKIINEKNESATVYKAHAFTTHLGRAHHAPPVPSYL